MRSSQLLLQLYLVEVLVTIYHQLAERLPQSQRGHPILYSLHCLLYTLRFILCTSNFTLYTGVREADAPPPSHLVESFYFRVMAMFLSFSPCYPALIYSLLF